MYQSRGSAKNKYWDFILIDCLVLVTAFLIAYFLRNGFHALSDLQTIRSSYIEMGFIILLLYLVVEFFSGNHKEILQRSYLKEVVAVVRQNTTVIIILVIYLFATKQTSVYSRVIIASFWLLSTVIMYMVRICWKEFKYSKIKKWKSKVNMLLLTDDKNVEETVRRMQQQPYHEIQLVGIAFLGTGANWSEAAVEGVPLLKGENVWKEYCKTNVIDEVFLKVSDRGKGLEDITNYLLSMGIVVHIDINNISSDMPNKIVEEIGGNVVVTTSVKNAASFQVLLKRGMDIAGSLAGLIITGLVCILLGPVIYLQSPGPIFFSQQRVGKNGRIFKIYKFRSMYPNAEEQKKKLLKENKMTGFMFKLDQDPRVIPIGRFMRKMSLDELPQFWNILKGDMSLVGTRPPTLDEYEQYDIRHRIRLSIKPGLTGLWQVSGRSNITDFEDVVALDQKYISEWSLGEDLKILVKTVKVVFAGEGAT